MSNDASVSDRYLVAYDIASPRRLRRVARCLEKHALRCQKSVFLFQGTAAQLDSLVRELASLINPDVDVVQAWRLSGGRRSEVRRHGRRAVVFPAAVVVQGRHVTLIEGDES